MGEESPSLAGWTRRDLLLVAVVPVVLVAIAAFSTWRYHRFDQSSWRGASFGMFATYEYEYGRTAQVTVIEDDGERTVQVPSGLQRLRDRALTIPGGPAAEELADRLAERFPGARVVVEIRGHDVRLVDDVEVGVRVLRTVTAP